VVLPREPNRDDQSRGPDQTTQKASSTHEPNELTRRAAKESDRKKQQLGQKATIRGKPVAVTILMSWGRTLVNHQIEKDALSKNLPLSLEKNGAVPHIR